MPFDDLDLEFEDEEESKRKKNEAVQVDVDLEFNSPEGGKPRPTQPARPQAPSAQSPAPSAQVKPGEVRKIEDARNAAARPGAPAARPTAPQPRVAGSSALQSSPGYDLESSEIVEMRERVKKVEMEAAVKVSVAEFKTEYLTEMLSDLKLVEHQIGQLLIRINAKHPDLKNEVLMIKKILADFNAKKRK